MIKIERTDSKNKDFVGLTHLLDAELNSRYGIFQSEYDKYNIIDSIDSVVLGYKDGKLGGCGCFKIFSVDTVEIKRMIVKLEYRGSGLAGVILTELENWAVERGFAQSILETGVKQPEAIRFYNKQGYQRISNYGQYIGNANSVCMSKDLK